MNIFDRTFHPDEANQAFTTGRLLETGTYRYDPQDHHGPTLYYAAATLQKAAGNASTATLDGTLLRCTPLLFAVLALVFGFLTIRKITERTWLGLLFALLLGTSPIFVFFATDFIQEMLLVSFTMMMFWTATNYLLYPSTLQPDSAKSSDATSSQHLNTSPSHHLRRTTWALLFGIAAGLAFATKETALLTFAAAGIAALLVYLTQKRLRTSSPQHLNTSTPLHLNHQLPTLLAISGFLLTATLLYSSFGANWSGVYNAFIAAPLSYFHRAAGSASSPGAAAHVHPWWQYLEWLFLGKAHITQYHIGGATPNMAAGAIALGWCAIPLLFRGIRQKITPSLLHTASFLTLYTIILLAFYSAIPYKTPWCTLQIHIGYIATSFVGFLVFGELITLLQRWLKNVDPGAFSRGWRPISEKTLSSIIATVAVATVIAVEYGPQLTCLIRNPDSKNIPYNYAAASPQVKELASLVLNILTPSPSSASAEGSGAASPQHLNTSTSQHLFAAVALPPEDTWPLPFYLRAAGDKIGYWTSFGELEALAGLGGKPNVVVVPAEEGHLVQPLFPHLKNTKRFEMRPHVRVRAFW